MIKLNIVTEPILPVLRRHAEESTITIINKRKCIREGWDDEVEQYERCGMVFTNQGCKCHPGFCPYCSSEVHRISITLPGVLECSAIGNFCSIKGA